MGVRGTETTIGQILNGYNLTVPRHQRPYSWELAELRELWQDLISFSEKYQGANVRGREYFLGSIVGQLKSDGQVLELLDGQQRLATLVILLATIRDTLSEAGEADDAKTIHLTCIRSASMDLDSPPDYRIRLGKNDDQFFRAVVLAYPPEEQRRPPIKTASQRSIVRAREFFEEQIKGYASSKGSTVPTVAKRLQSVVTKNVMVIRVHSEEWDDVTEVFERLNDRGKGLSTLDLLRVYLIGQTHEKDQADAEEAWGRIYELSDSATKVDAFLRHTYITHRGDVKSRSLYKEIKSVMESANRPTPFKSPLTLTQSLAGDVEAYKSVLNASHTNDSCAHWLRAISTLGATSLLPAALAAQIALPKDSVAHSALLRRLVSTFVRWNVITGGESTELEEAVYKVARSVRSGTDVDEAVQTLLPFQRDDETVVDSFKSLTLSRSGYQRYILEALEDYHIRIEGEDTVEKPTAGAQTLWIEHIYPQKPDTTWGRWEEHDKWINRIGNLTLIHKRLNNVAKNKPFQDKLPTYSESGIILNQALLKQKSWSPDAIAKRQEELSAIVTKVWPGL